MVGFRFGFGLSSNAGSGFYLHSPKNIPVLVPSVDWTGVAGSGFGALPVDPDRITAKPIIRLITPPWQWFAPGERVHVGVAALANENGTLVSNMGLERVRVHYEGNTTDILSPSFLTARDANGIDRSYFGWWVDLKNDGRFGAADLYFEAIPNDALLQRRVIGPYRYRPNATKYTHEIDIHESNAEVAGTSYQGIPDAIGYLRGLSGQINPLLTIRDLSTNLLDSHSLGYNIGNLVDGWLNVTSDVPITFSDSSNPPNIGPVTNSAHFLGANITFDLAQGRGLSLAPGWPGHGYWLDGVTIINSAGSTSLFEKKPNIGGGNSAVASSAGKESWITECVVADIANIAVDAGLVRGGAFIDCFGDLFTNALCVIGTVSQNFGFAGHREAIDAMSITYTGAEATASVEISLGAGSDNRVLTARWGSNSANFTIRTDDPSGGNYDISDVVNWVNATLAGLDTGWSATLLDDTRRAANIVVSASDLVNAYPETSVKDTLLTLQTAFDLHGDWYQGNFGASPVENRLIINNKAFDMEGQGLFAGNWRDAAFINNLLHFKENSAAPNQFSQTSGEASHTVWAHNTVINQGLWIRFDGGSPFYPDGFTLFANNYFDRVLTINGDATSFALVDNQTPALSVGGLSPIAIIGEVGTVNLGTNAGNFPDAGTGNFTPADDALTNLKAPRVQWDANGESRADAAPVGGISQSDASPVIAMPTPAPIPTPPSSPSVAELIADFVATLSGSTNSAAYDPFDLSTLWSDLGVTQAVADGPVRQLDDVSGNGHNATAGADSRRPTATNGLTFDGAGWPNADLIEAPMQGGSGSTDMTLLALYKGTDTEGSMFGSGGNYAARIFGSGGTFNAAGTPTTHVDGGPDLPTNTAFRDAVADGAAHLVEVRNANLSTWGSVQMGRNQGFGWELSGVFIPIARIDNTAVSDAAASLAAAQALGEAMRDLVT